jgi:cation diffusion facilitator CzcD-associated flavoprotein CzcO
MLRTGGPQAGQHGDGRAVIPRGGMDSILRADPRALPAQTEVWAAVGREVKRPLIASLARPSVSLIAMDRHDVLIVGAGPAGLAVAASLRRHHVPFAVIEAGTGVGASWRAHYDRLCLHTVKAHSALPGLAFATDVPRFPTRAQVIAYLESYAAHFGIAPRFNTRLERATPSSMDGAGWEVHTSEGPYRVRHLVMATGLNRRPVRPSWPGESDYRGRILHSVDYRSGAPFSGQRVVVVGMGNTGAEIALDLHEHGAHATISVRTPANILPREFLGTPLQVTALRMARLPVWLRDRMGRFTARMAFGDLSAFGLPAPAYGPATQMRKYGRTPVLDVGTVQRIRAGDIAVVPGIESFTATGIRCTDGRTVEADVVILATGYRAALHELIDAPGLIDADGAPRLEVAGNPAARTIHFIGYRNTMTGLLRQVGIDAESVARAIELTPL